MKGQLLSRLALLAVTAVIVIHTVDQVKTHLQPFTIANYLAPEHPARLAYERYREHYDDECYAYLLFESQSPLALETDFSFMDFNIASWVENVPGVEAVQALSRIQYLNDPMGEEPMASFFPRGRLSEEGSQLLRGDPLFGQTLLAEDREAWLMGITFHQSLEGKSEQLALRELFAVVERVESQFPQLSVHALGGKVAKYHFVREVIRSQRLLNPLLFLLIALSLWVLLRSLRVMLGALHLLLLAYALMMLLIIANEGGLGPYSAYALFFITVVGTSDLVHLLTASGEYAHLPLEDQLSAARARVFKPCGLTTFTTFFTFIALTFSDIALVSNFGWYCALGTLLCFFLTFYYFPFFLRVFSLSPQPSREWIHGSWFRTATRGRRYRRLVLGGFLLAALFFFGGVTRLHLDDDFNRKFSPSHALSKATSTFEEKFKFSGTLDLVVQPQDLRILDPDLSFALASLQKELAELPNITTVKSVESFRGHVRNRIPTALEDQRLVLEMFLEDGVLDPYVRVDDNEARFVLFVRSIAYSEIAETLASVKKLMENDAYRRFLSGELLGMVTIRTVVLGQIFRGFIVAFGSSFVVLWAVFLGTFRSPRWATLAMVPNLFPLLAIGGLMGIFGVAVENNLVILVCTTLGIAVDDTLHFLVAARRNLDAGLGHEEAMEQAQAQTGTALVATTAIFVISVSCFFLSELTFFRHIGLFLMVAMTLALASDLLLLPLILPRLKKKST